VSHAPVRLLFVVSASTHCPCSCRTNLFFYEGSSTFDKSTRPWFFSWTFCIASCTIISGCLAERTALSAYPVATLLISGIVHPLLVHWLWSPYGWMSNIGECQVLDFAGEQAAAAAVAGCCCEN
jgi:Amt family ammonium transporter